MFQRFANDLVTIRRPDGTVVADPVRADVQTKMIFIEDASIPIEPGYVISRTLPSGVTEEFIVEEPGFHQKVGGFNAHYQIKVSRRGAQPRTASTTYNLSGNARINIGAYDASRNVVYHSGSTEELFDSLRQALMTEVADTKQQALLLDAVAKMKESAGTSTFNERYKQFINLAAAHITVLTPFIPALTQLIMQHGH